ncbi:hypothetical protein LEP1GSC071_3718 [Leptospira santarosai str. JET]|nr:hypothetical protein LEP1GSC071_3718 [Leptospira santarosai str. JET]
MVFLSSKFICNLAKVIFIPKNGNSFPRIFKRVYFWNFFLIRPVSIYLVYSNK